MKGLIPVLLTSVIIGCGDSGKSGHPNANVPHCSSFNIYTESVEDGFNIHSLSYNECDNITEIRSENNIVVTIKKGVEEYLLLDETEYTIKHELNGYRALNTISEQIIFCDKDDNCVVYGNGSEYLQALSDMEWASERAVISLQDHVKLYSLFED